MSDVIEAEPEPGTALGLLPAAKLPVILAADTNDILGKLKAELDGWEKDVSTVKGRAEIRSKRQKVRIARADFKRLAETLKEGAIKTQRDVNAEFKILDGRMEGLIASVGAELDAIEAAEEAQRKANEGAIAAMEALVEGLGVLSPDEIQARAASLAPFDWSIEFRSRAEKVRAGVLAQLRVGYTDAVQREADALAEQQRAAEQAERDRLAAIEARRVREEQIARDAAVEARLAAEAEAERKAREAQELAQAALQAAEALRVHQAEEAERKRAEAAEALAKAERERLAGIEREKAAAEKAETGRIERERVIAERERLAEENAEKQRAAAAAKADRERDAAVEAERERVAREVAAQKAADEERAADIAHRTTINREVIADLMAVRGDVTDDLAKVLLVAIVRGNVRNCRVKY